MEPIFELALVLPRRGSRELLRALHSQLRKAIIDGRLKPGVRLPPTRQLAAAKGVSRNTALAAYELLLSEGYLVARRGSGTFVATAIPARGKSRPPTTSSANDRRLNPFWRHPPPPLRLQRQQLRYNFQLGAAEQALFPFDVWRSLSARAIRQMALSADRHGEVHGRAALREAIAHYISLTRAVACGPDDIVVTTGAQQAFDLLARVLVSGPQMVVAVENPGYPPLRTPFEASGAKLAPTPVDGDGLLVSSLSSRARVVCVTPSHQFPLGSPMSMARRVELLQFAQARGAVIIEDDYDAEFRFGGQPLDALQTLDRSESVFYVGTFSKSLFPAIRMGFIVTPPWARTALHAAKESADSRCPVQTQDTLAAFIADGHMARHVRRMRQIYDRRRELILESLNKHFSRWLQPVPSSAGLHLTAFAKMPLDANELAKRARELDVGVHPLTPFYLGKPTRAGIALGYGAIEEPAIIEGLARLRRVLAT